MAKYYSQASCCVVVSEMFRRRYSHSWEDRLESPKGHECEVGSAWKGQWGIHDELIGWVIGFHEFRVWAFREHNLLRSLYIGEGTFKSTPRQLFPWARIPCYPWVRLTVPGISTASEERALRLADHLSGRPSAEGIKQVHIDRRSTKQ